MQISKTTISTDQGKLMKPHTIMGTVTQMNKRLILAIALALGIATPVKAQGTVPLALQQIVDTTGKPIVGALLYFYQVGTVATRQDSFQDSGLSLVNQWPLPTDAFGRMPMFYLASGSVHIRLTDANGLQLVDVPNALVVGPSGGGGGGGGSVDPTTIFSTGDFKFRPTGETLTGWVKANGLTIGSAVSGATQRANADTQNLFVYLWSNCHLCTVTGGKGSSGLSDFNANKQISVPDCRASICGMGVDDMGNSAAGILLAQNIFSGGDTPTTPGAQAGEDNHTLTQPQLPASTYSLTGTPQTWASSTSQPQSSFTSALGNGTGGTGSFSIGTNVSINTQTPVTPNGTVGPIGSGSSHNVVTRSLTGTWFVKL